MLRWKTSIAVLALLLIANLFYVRYSSVNKIIVEAEPSVLRTYKTSGNCFYQKSDSKKWLFLSGEEIITSGTELQTDANSQATLSFIGQSGRLELAQQTHVVMRRQNSYTMIDFKKGETYINYQASNVNRPLLVKVNNKVFQLTNADLFVTGDIEDQVQITIEYGKVTMNQGENSTVFEKGQFLILKNEREYIVEDSKIGITTPFNYDRYNLKDREYKVRFAYTSLPEDIKIQLLLGKDIEKMNPHFSEPQSFSSNEFVVSLPKGTYYWQIVGYKNGEKVFLEPLKKFFIEPQAPIQLVKPHQSSKFQLVAGSVDIQFQWDNPSQLEKVFIEISEHKDFSKTLVNEAIPDNNYFNYKFHKAGEFYWRVSGFPFGTTELISSQPNRIEIVNDIIPQQVRILFPKDNTTLTTYSLKSSDITFQWSENPLTKIYSVEIKSLKTGKALNIDTEKNQLKIKDLEPGQYEWKVFDKISGLASFSERFQVVQTRRLSFKKESDEAGYLSWQSGPRGTVQYRVEALRIGSRSDFNAFFDPQNATKRSLEITGDKISYKNFSEGIYAFKVYALDSNKNILADSNLKFLKVRKKE